MHDDERETTMLRALLVHVFRDKVTDREIADMYLRLERWSESPDPRMRVPATTVLKYIGERATFEDVIRFVRKERGRSLS